MLTTILVLSFQPVMAGCARTEQNKYLIVYTAKILNIRSVTTMFASQEKQKAKKRQRLTIISGLLLGVKGLKKLARQLKHKYNAGDTVRDGNIEIQGEQKYFLIRELLSLG